MRHSLALAVFALSGGVVLAQEKVENPAYANWVKFKPGTRVVTKTSAVSAAFRTDTVLTSTLVEVLGDKLVVEQSVVTKQKGKDVPSLPMKQEVAKTITLAPGETKDGAGIFGKPVGTKNEGTEKLKIAGMDVNTTWFEWDSKEAGKELKAKLWVSADVPGLIVKMEYQSGGATPTTMTTELVEVKKP